MLLLSVSGKTSANAVKILCRCLEKHGGVLLCTDNAAVAHYIYTPDFVMFAPKSETYRAPAQAIRLQIKDDTAELGYLIKNQTKAKLTIGLSSACDITVSSIHTNGMSVSVQRVVSAISGGMVLPCEITAEYKEAPNDIHILLCAVAVLLISEKLDPLSKKIVF